MRRKTKQEMHLDAIMGLPFPDEWPHEQITVTVLDVAAEEILAAKDANPELSEEKVPTTDFVFQKKGRAWHFLTHYPTRGTR